MVFASAKMTERELLAAARSGDEDAFRRLVDPHRAALLAHCYRMLGSVHDSEDVLQNVLLRAWRGLCGFRGRSTLRNWLYRIATNACVDALERSRARVLPIESGRPSAESLWVEPHPDQILGVDENSAAPATRYEQREAVELAFVAALRYLTLRQGVVLILREVLGFSADEVAQALGTSAAAVNSALQRARRTLEERPAASSQQATMHSPGEKRLREIAHDFADAVEGGDVAAIVSLLAENAPSAFPSYREWNRRPRRDRRLDALAGSAAGSPHERAKAA